MLIDQTNQHEYVPLNNIAPDQAKIEIYNSLLSEAGVLGFEYGYSLADPRTLVLWEGQFGDFANGAQVIIDQFIASGETKWLRMSGLVMLLPHGYEGQGPEHSSARIERYLQLVRRAQHVGLQPDHAGELFPRAAAAVAPQFPQAADRVHAEIAVAAQAGGVAAGGLRPKAAASGSSSPRSTTSRRRSRCGASILCSGKVYYDLLQERRAKDIKDVAIIRLEQIYPFPENTLGRVLKPYTNADVVWCQEEPENMGAWNFVDRRIERVLHRLEMKSVSSRLYRARGGGQSRRPGWRRTHMAQQARLVTTALGRLSGPVRTSRRAMAQTG